MGPGARRGRLQREMGRPTSELGCRFGRDANGTLTRWSVPNGNRRMPRNQRVREAIASGAGAVRRYCLRLGEGGRESADQSPRSRPFAHDPGERSAAHGRPSRTPVRRAVPPLQRPATSPRCAILASRPDRYPNSDGRRPIFFCSLGIYDSRPERGANSPLAPHPSRCHRNGCLPAPLRLEAIEIGFARP